MVSRILNDFSQPFEPSDATAYERYQAMVPILGEASQTYLRMLSEAPSQQRDTEIQKSMTGLFESAAERSGKMSVEEVRRSFLAYTTLGMPGLMTPIPLDAGRVARSFNGTWEMRHRFTDGGKTPYAGERHQTTARSHIYYDLVDPEDNHLRQLTMMWTEENHYPRKEALARDMPDRNPEDQTFLLSSLVDIKLRQVDPWTVEYSDDGMVFGNHGPYINGVRCISIAYMMRFGASESLIGMPETSMVHPDGTREPVVGMFLLLNVMGGAPTALSFPMSGLPAMNGDLPTFDTVDSYTKVNSDRPLIGGFEPIDVYFNRLRDPGGFMREAETKTRTFGGAAAHGFHPQSMDALRSYRRDY